MGVVQVRLPDHLKQIIDRQAAEGRAASEQDFMLETARRYAEDEIVAIAEEGNTALKRGDYVTISSPEEAEALHQRTMARLRRNLAAEG